MPHVHFHFYDTSADAKPIDWRKAPDAEDPDDEQLPETPVDVVKLLGFDPAEDDDHSRGES